MAAASSNKDANTISMIGEKWAPLQVEQFSPVNRIDGYPWRLRVFKGDGNLHNLALICDKSNESELWQCKVLVNVCLPDRFELQFDLTFNSWDTSGKQVFILPTVTEMPVNVEIFSHGEVDDRWTLRPTLDPLETRDGVLIVGEEKKKVYVNKKSLASISPYFDRLFNGYFKEKNMREIPIGDVEYEECSNIIRMIYGFDGATLNDANVQEVLQLADRFELKIVEDRAINYLLSSSSSIPLQQKLLISEMFHLPFLKKILFERDCSTAQLIVRELSDSPEWDLLSKKTLRVLFKKVL